MGCSLALYFVYLIVNVYLRLIQEVWLLVYLTTCFFPLAFFQIIIVKHVMNKPLKRQSRLQQTTIFATSFPIFDKNKAADDSHEISCLIGYF